MTMTPSLTNKACALGARLRTRWFATPAAILLFSALATAEQKRWGPTPVASSYGHRFEELFWLITILTSVSFAIVCIMLAIVVRRDRARPGHKASYDHGSSLHDKRLSAFISVTVFLVLDWWVLVISVGDLRQAFWKIPSMDEEGVFRVEVLAQQWAWNFRTPGVDGEFGTADDIVTINELHLPLDRPISMNMTSKDVIHSFFMPDMRFKRDINPGAVTLAWFKPIIPGDYDLLCAELCGFAHYQMRSGVTILEQDDFNVWEQEASRLAEAAYDAEDHEAHWAWSWRE